MAILNSATAPGRSDFSERATPSQLWASADCGPTSTARRNSSRARGYSFRPQYARPSATRAAGLRGSFLTAASSWLTDGGGAFLSWPAAVVAPRARTRRAAAWGRRLIGRDHAELIRRDRRDGASAST